VPGDLAEWIIEEWHRRNPQYAHVTIEYILATYGEDAEVELDTLIAAGETPNILEGFGGRMAGYWDVGIPLEGYYTDEMIADFLPGHFESIFVGDHIPMATSVASFYYPVANVGLLERAGIEIPESWAQLTWEEFKDIGKAVKALDDGSYGSCIFVGNPSAIQWMWIPFGGAGVSMFKPPDFKNVTFNQPEAVEMLAELIRFEKEGYIVPGAAGLGVFDCVDYLKEGKLAIFFAQIASARLFISAAVEAGLLEEAYEAVPLLPFRFKEDITPLVLGGGSAMGAIVTDITPEEHREAAFSFAYFVTGFPFADHMGLYAPYLQSQIDQGLIPAEEEALVLDYMLEHGTAECGFVNPHFTSLRPLWTDEMQAAFLGLKTPEQAFADFEANARKALSE